MHPRKLFCESPFCNKSFTIEKDNSVKTALDSQNLNKITVERKAQMLYMKELIS